MQVAIVHYHLNRGGVTQVIANHLRALSATHQDERLRVVVLFGGRRTGWPDTLVQELRGLELQLVEVTGLDYHDDDEPAAPPDLLHGQLLQTLQRLGMGPRDTILHVHNHSLGKNASLPRALWGLAEEGYPLLLQVHDFAEDFRPDNFRHLAEPGEASVVASERLYPQADHVHYAVLNGRDLRILAAAGLARDRLHALPNPVAGFGGLPSRRAAREKMKLWGVSPEDRLLLYPVRGIRRKNLGEALLWSALSAGEAKVALTLPPLNPSELGPYDRWRELAGRLQLPFIFEAGAPGGLTYAENLAAADLILTTSVAEGFGMVFLESWLTGRPLVGRDLPEITADFVASGVCFANLAPRLDVPLSWIGRERFVEELWTCYRRVLQSFGLELPSRTDVEVSLETTLQSGLVDFAALTHNSQVEVMERVCRDAGSRDALLERNPTVQRALTGSLEELGRDVERNAGIVRDGYSLQTSGDRLRKLYLQVLTSPRGSPLQFSRYGASVLEAFLDVARLQPVRIET